MADALSQAILASNGRDTVFTPATDYVFDHGLARRGWPEGVAVRHRPNKIAEAWAGKERDLANNPDTLAAYYQRITSGDPAVTWCTTVRVPAQS